MNKIQTAMATLRASLVDGGATESAVDAKITALNTEIGGYFIPFMGGSIQPLIDAVNNSSELTAGEKVQFITDLG
jgi:hypothetical protein